jgi:hypothetical protein
MPDIEAQIRNRKRRLIKCIQGPLTYAERKAFSLASDIALESYPADRYYLGEPLILYYLELARITACETGMGLSAAISALLSGVSEGSEGWKRIDEIKDPSIKTIITGL